MESSAAQILTNFVSRLLVPIARFCIKRGIRFQVLSVLLKEAFLKAAKYELQITGKEINTSRLSAMTGLQRKEVSGLLSDSKQQQTQETKPGLPGRVLEQWRRDKQFLNQDQNPRPLSCEGVKNEFEDLVRSVSNDLSPYTLLFELERTGAIQKLDGKVHLIADAYVPRKDLGSALQIVASDTDDFLQATEKNIFDTPEVPNLHVRTEYDNIALEHLTEIQNWLLQKGSEFHAEIRQYLSSFDCDLNTRLSTKEGGGRVVIGSFSFTEANEEEENS